MHRLRMSVCLFLLLFVFAFSAGAAETVVLTYGEWPPYHSSLLPGKGVASIVYTEAFARVDVDVEYELLPWKRAYEKAKYGDAIGSVGWLKIGNREKDFYFSDPVMDSETVFFHNRDNQFVWKHLEDVKDMRIAVTLGDSSCDLFQAVTSQGSGSINITKGYMQGMRMLVAGRVDLFVCNKVVGLNILKNQFPEAIDIVAHPVSIRKGTSHLIISRRMPQGAALIEKFNMGLQQLKESGRYQQIFTEFFIGKPAL